MNIHSTFSSYVPVIIIIENLDSFIFDFSYLLVSTQKLEFFIHFVPANAAENLYPETFLYLKNFIHLINLCLNKKAVGSHVNMH